jgi:hypothetical protein
MEIKTMVYLGNDGPSRPDLNSFPTNSFPISKSSPIFLKALVVLFDYKSKSGSWTFVDAAPKPLADTDVEKVAARPVIPVTGSATASANRVGDDAAAQVGILVKFPFAGPVNLGASTVTINSLLNERGGTRELVKGTGGVDLLPITLRPRSGSKPTAAIFETPSRAIPKVRLEIQTKGQGVFDFLLRVDRATIPAFPQLCGGEPRPTTDLVTNFIIDDGVNPIVVSTKQPWRCLDLVDVLRAPQRYHHGHSECHEVWWKYSKADP